MGKFILECDKELEDVLENCPFGNKNSKLLAYVTEFPLHKGSDERKEILDGTFEGTLYFVYEKTHELAAMQ